VGWAVAPPELMAGIRPVHDFLTVAAAAPLQEAGVVALNLPEPFYEQQADEYRERRDLLMAILVDTGFGAKAPEGAYYVMADISHLGFADDLEAATRLVEDAGVAVVPGSSFFSRPELGRHLVRFAFCKKLETLEEAGRRLRAFPGGGG
jgi:aminotransferase